MYLMKCIFLLGNSKELKQKHILNAKGQLTSDFNKDYFKQTDLRTTEFVPSGELVSVE